MASHTIDLVPVDDSSSINVVHVQEPKAENLSFGHSPVITNTAPILAVSPPDDSDAESGSSRQGHELRYSNRG